MTTYETVAAQLTAGIIEDGYAVVDDLLDLSVFKAIRYRFDELQDEDEFEKAGIGKQLQYTIDKQVRGDFIRWIDPADQTASVYELYRFINAFKVELNRSCYLGIKDMETHYAFYPEGRGYQKHRDRFKTNPHRIVSFVYYLNEGWQAGDGGELVLYDEDERGIKTVEPKANRLAVFLSETVHEVLNCNTERRSITGWLLDVPVELTFLG
ncbi:MAG: 2OG-Fe(II) oxygenase [Flavobacteriales bacterium]|nr:2OG-Fe(II) oxygenase [Flavobacteriales bacterium]